MAQLAAGVGGQEVVLVALGPLLRARCRSARRRPRRWCSVTARPRGRRSRSCAASRPRRATASPAAAARPAAWPARPRSRRSSSRGRCAGSGRGAGRRGSAGRRGRRAWRPRRTPPAAPSACSASSGTTASAASSRPVMIAASSAAAAAGRVSEGKCSRSALVHLARAPRRAGSTRRRSRRRTPGRASRGRRTGRGRWPARGPSRRWRCAGTAAASPAGAASVPPVVDVEPAVERGDVLGAGPGQHLVHLDVGVHARRHLAEHLHQRVLAEGHRGVGLLAAEQRRVRLQVELVARHPVEPRVAAGLGRCASKARCHSAMASRSCSAS